jgi:predicted nucleotidyltransferase
VPKRLVFNEYCVKGIKEVICIMDKSIDKMTDRIVSILKGNNPSIYLYGSVVYNDFQLGWSDIDILCVTEHSIDEDQKRRLVNLRQEMLEEESNSYYRSFEGGILSFDTFLGKSKESVVYWGTSGQRLDNQYIFDTFSMIELLDKGKILYGKDIRNFLSYPTREEVVTAVRQHYFAIRKYAVKTDRSMYSAGWLLDIARCIYTLRTGKVIAKTDAGLWAIRNGIVPDVKVMERVIEIRKNPLLYRNDEDTQVWLETLGIYVQRFADVLEMELTKNF